MSTERGFNTDPAIERRLGSFRGGLPASRNAGKPVRMSPVMGAGPHPAIQDARTVEHAYVRNNRARQVLAMADALPRQIARGKLAAMAKAAERLRGEIG
ncbi:MAG: hypothetical protein QOG28_1426 [Trebonia sp.]|jgi:hypothetical protein|nr:hypothetical protein [Trebonia sp.]